MGHESYNDWSKNACSERLHEKNAHAKLCFPSKIQHINGKLIKMILLRCLFNISKHNSVVFSVIFWSLHCTHFEGIIIMAYRHKVHIRDVFRKLHTPVCYVSGWFWPHEDPRQNISLWEKLANLGYLHGYKSSILWTYLHPGDVPKACVLSVLVPVFVACFQKVLSTRETLCMTLFKLQWKFQNNWRETPFGNAEFVWVK